MAEQWIGGIGQVERIPYRLPELVAADAAETIYFVEGERKADKLAGMGQWPQRSHLAARGGAQSTRSTSLVAASLSRPTTMTTVAVRQQVKASIEQAGAIRCRSSSCRLPKAHT